MIEAERLINEIREINRDLVKPMTDFVHERGPLLTEQEFRVKYAELVADEALKQCI